MAVCLEHKQTLEFRPANKLNKQLNVSKYIEFMKATDKPEVLETNAWVNSMSRTRKKNRRSLNY